MTAYIPSQGGYPVSQPVMQMGQPYGMPASYAHTGGMMYVPSHATSHHSRRRRYRHSYPSYGYDGYSGPTVVSAMPGTVAAPMMVQPAYGGYGYDQYGQGYYGQGYGYDPHSWGSRVRRFLGLAPTPNVRYKRDRATWGFMGYSRRQQYRNAYYPNQEVDRNGRPVIRI